MSDYDHAMKVNQQHKLINGKLQMKKVDSLIISLINI